MSEPALTADSFLAECQTLPGVRTFEPLGEAVLKYLPPDAKQPLDSLPTIHRDLLKRSNGLMAWSGYFRLFGFGYTPQGATDAFIWNMPNMWKFAWVAKAPQCAEFFSFGEDGWGQQYAYRRAGGALDPAAGIFRLDALKMNPTQIAGSIEEFLTKEWLVNARKPKDKHLAAAAAKMGPLNPDQQVNLVPSPLIGGALALENVRLVTGRQAMILNGDIFTQWSKSTPGSVLQRIDTWHDQLGVMRLTLIFGAPGSVPAPAPTPAAEPAAPSRPTPPPASDDWAE